MTEEGLDPQLDETRLLVTGSSRGDPAVGASPGDACVQAILELVDGLPESLCCLSCLEVIVELSPPGGGLSFLFTVEGFDPQMFRVDPNTVVALATVEPQTEVTDRSGGPPSLDNPSSFPWSSLEGEDGVEGTNF